MQKGAVALNKEIGGCEGGELCCVDLPKTVRAGTDSLFIQKDTWDRITVIMQGIYV